MALSQVIPREDGARARQAGLKGTMGGEELEPATKQTLSTSFSMRE